MVLDHVYGKPSTTWKRLEAILLTLISLKILRTFHNRNPPGGARRLNKALSKFAPWQIVLGTLTSGYLLSKFSLLTFMNATEQYAHYYNRNFYRATWILTALDAGFWSTMHMRPKWIRDTCSTVMTIVYLVFADRAINKTRRIGAAPTVQNLRVSWNKRSHPVLTLLCRAMQPRIGVRGKSVYVPRNRAAFGYDPNDSNSTTTRVALYFQGSEDDLVHVRTVILHFPGGGFVCMGPETHEDYLVEWAHRSPYTLVVAVDYNKAPEYPYPYAHFELFELYALIRETNGKCLGLAGWDSEVHTHTISSLGPAITNTTRVSREPIRLTISGDSAGGNFVVGVVARAIERNIVLPEAILLAYPHLNFDLACWLTPQQLTLLRVESAKNVNAHLDIHRIASSTHMQPLNGGTTGILSPTSTRSNSEVAIDSHRRGSAMSLPNVPTTMAALLIEDEASLSRTQSFFGIAATKLSALRTQKPASVFDDYGNPSMAHELYPTSRAVTPSNALCASPSHHTAGESAVSRISIHTKDASMAESSTRFEGVVTREPCSLTMTSQMCYFSDRILSPETMRACGLLYMAPSSVPIDLKNDYYLSPSRTPFHLLAKFPRVYMLCGEKDPLVDDTVLFAGRLRDAKRRAWEQSGERSMGGYCPSDSDVCEVVILEGVSHAMLQIMGILPEGRDCVHLLHKWMHETLFPRHMGRGSYYEHDMLSESVQSTPVSKPRDLSLSLSQGQTSSGSSSYLGRSKFTIGPSDHGGMMRTMSDSSDSSLESVGDGKDAHAESSEPATVPKTPTNRLLTSPVAPTTAKQNTDAAAKHADEDGQWLELRDSNRAKQHALLTKRTVDLTQKLFADGDKQPVKSRASSSISVKDRAAVTGSINNLSSLSPQEETPTSLPKADSL